MGPWRTAALCSLTVTSQEQDPKVSTLADRHAIIYALDVSVNNYPYLYIFTYFQNFASDQAICLANGSNNNSFSKVSPFG